MHGLCTIRATLTPLLCATYAQRVPVFCTGLGKTRQMSCRACRWTSIIAPYIPARHFQYLRLVYFTNTFLPLCMYSPFTGRTTRCPCRLYQTSLVDVPVDSCAAFSAVVSSLAEEVALACTAPCCILMCPNTTSNQVPGLPCRSATGVHRK